MVVESVTHNGLVGQVEKVSDELFDGKIKTGFNGGFKSFVNNLPYEIKVGVCFLGLIVGGTNILSSIKLPGDICLIEKEGYVHVNKAAGRFMSFGPSDIDKTYKLLGTRSSSYFENIARRGCDMDVEIFDGIVKKLNPDGFIKGKPRYFLCENPEIIDDSTNLVRYFNDDRISPNFTISVGWKTQYEDL